MSDREPSSARASDLSLVRGSLLALVAFVVLKYLVLLSEVDWDVARSPFVPLVVVTVLAALLIRTVGRRRWVAPVALGLFGIFVVVVVSALVRDGLARQSWADYPFAYGGLAAALLGGLGAWRLWRSRSAVRIHPDAGADRTS